MSETGNLNNKTTIYILRLKEGRYYVGKTSRDVKQRIEEHNKVGGGTAWTRRYQVLGLYEEHFNQDPFDEDKFVKKYMGNFGIAMVRGGAYSNTNLTRAQMEILTKELRHATDRCFECGSTSHFVTTCPKKPSIAGRSHRQHQNCKGLTLKGEPCQCFKFLTREGYCRAHQEQGDGEPESIVDPLAALSRDVDNTCRGHNQGGMLCQTTRFLSIGGYCWNHEDQESIDQYDMADSDKLVSQPSLEAVFASLSTREGSSSCRGKTQSGSRCQRRTCLNDEGYCTHHADQAGRTNEGSYRLTVCCGKTQSGSRCQRSMHLNSGGYCTQHEYQADLGRSVEAGAYRPGTTHHRTCRGKTQAGSQCRRSLYLNTDGYCSQHAAQVGKKNRSATVSGTSPCRGTTQGRTRCQRHISLNRDGYCSHHANQAKR